MLKRVMKVESQVIDTGFAKYKISRYKSNLPGIHAVSIIRYRLGVYDPEYTRYFFAPSMWLAYRILPKMLAKC